jgi:hypothetical protein
MYHVCECNVPSFVITLIEGLNGMDWDLEGVRVKCIWHSETICYSDGEIQNNKVWLLLHFLNSLAIFLAERLTSDFS